MSVLKKISLFCAAAVLGACTTSINTPLAKGVAGNAGGIYSVTQNGTTRVLGDPQGTLLSLGFDLSLFYWDNPVNKGHMYEDANVVAIAVMDKLSNETIAGISGTASTTVPTGGTGTYAGSFSAAYFRSGTNNEPWNSRGTFTTDINFGSGVVTGSGTGNNNSTLSINGTLTGAAIDGMATFSGLEYTGDATVPMSGGLYGTGTFAAIYQGTSASGVIWGVTP